MLNLWAYLALGTERMGRPPIIQFCRSKFLAFKTQQPTAGLCILGIISLFCF